MSSKEYVVKYLGIVEGNVGCLSRKMPLPQGAPERQQPTGFVKSKLKEFKHSGRQFHAPVLRNKYNSSNGGGMAT